MTGKRPQKGSPHPSDHDGISPAAVAAIGVAVALAEAMPRTAKAPEYDLDAEVAAVIASSLALAEADELRAARAAQVRQVPVQPVKAATGPGPWANAGRMRQMAARSQPLVRGRRSR